MDTSGSSAGQVPALNVVFLPAPPTSTATVVEQPSCIAEEYRKVHTGVTDFVDTVGKILRESGHGLDDDRLSKLLFSLGSLPLTSEAELSQNAQQLTCFILTALTVIAEIMKKTVIKHPTSAEPQASSSEGGDHSSMKKVEHKEPQDSSGEGGDHISMKTEEHVKGRPASIVSAKRKEMFDTDPVTVDARVASASSTATLLTQTNREESRDSLEQPYRKKSTRLMRKTADKKGHNAAEGKRQKEDSFITSHSSSTSAVLDQPPSIVPKPEPEDDRVVSSDKTQTKRLKIARRDTSYVARSRLAPRDKAQGNETDCEICGCAPGGTHILKLHMPDCVCKVCNMECNTEKLLEAHMRTHKTAVKKLHVEKKKHVREKKPRVKEKEVCHVCGLSLNKSRMQHHMLRHGSVKDHVCQTCGKAYYDLKALRRHEAVHGGQRYVCPTCGKTSNTQENLSKHAKRCKGAPETFKCQLCPEEFSVKRELDNHMYAHRVAQAEKHACAVCGREYSERFHLTRHMQKAHQAELEPVQ